MAGTGEDRAGNALGTDDITAADVLNHDAPADRGRGNAALLGEAGDASAAADEELYATEAEAAARQGDELGQTVLGAARALLLDGEGSQEALPLWHAVFEKDPALLIGFWGLRRALVRLGRWEDVAAVIEGRLRLVPAVKEPPASDATAGGATAREAALELRAELWTERGRIFEDRLARFADAAESYRSALREAPAHAGALLSLLLLGWRTEDAATVADALRGLLAPQLRAPPPLRAELAAALSAIERTGGLPEPQRAALPAAGTAARRVGDFSSHAHPASRPAAERDAAALATLDAALEAVPLGQARIPLLAELAALARETSDAETRGAALARLAVETVDEHPDLAVAFMRWRARHLRDVTGDAKVAEGILEEALARFPGNPLVIADLADLAESDAGHDARGGDDATDRLERLLERIAPTGRPLGTEAERELAVRAIAALARDGRPERAERGLELLNARPELSRERADLFAIEVALRASVGDVAGLAGIFEAKADRATDLLDSAEATEVTIVPGSSRVAATGGSSEAPVQSGGGAAVLVAAGPDGGARAEAEPAAEATSAAHALVTAGVLHALAGGPGGAAAAERSWRRALALVPGHRFAVDALERMLWASGRWSELAELWRRESDSSPARRLRALENLVALSRDVLDDPGEALAALDRLAADPEAAAFGEPTRMRVRRRDLELTQLARRSPVDSARAAQTLRALAADADAPQVEAALLIEAGHLAEAEDRDVARAAYRAAFALSPEPASASGLERLANDLQERIDVVRAELAAIEAGGRPNDDGEGEREGDAETHPTSLRARAQARGRALRYRLAWHALSAHQVDAALEALAPLRNAGDALAHAWSWEIARRARNPALELAILGTPPTGAAAARLEVPEDLGDALERAGDLAAAETAYREALRTSPSIDAALGLLRVAAASGGTTAAIAAMRDLAARSDDAARPMLEREAAMLTLSIGADEAGPGAVEALAEVPVDGVAGPPSDEAPSDEASSSGASRDEAPRHEASGEPDAAEKAVWRWMAGVRSRDPRRAVEGLLAIAEAIPATTAADAAADRNSVLARATARARLVGPAHAGATAERALALSVGAAPIGVALADLPAQGRTERIVARAARAGRTTGQLAVALDVERALQAELAGDRATALEAYGRALAREPETLDALEGVRRIAKAEGDKLGAARVAMRLGVLLRDADRAASELADAARTFEDIGREAEAVVAYWRALERDPDSEVLSQRLERLLRRREDHQGLDRLYGRRLAVVGTRRERLATLLARATHRLDRLGTRETAIHDFKRILELEPRHPIALRRLATLAIQMEHFHEAATFLKALIDAEPGESSEKAAARLELADAYEAAREPGRAIEALRDAIAALPSDLAAWRRLADLHLRVGDWPNAVETLRAWERVTAEPPAKARLWMRIGVLLRDHGREPTGAATAFSQAVRLDLFGEGLPALLDLYERVGDWRARDQVLDRAIAGLRAELATNPLEVPRLRLLAHLSERAARSAAADGRRRTILQGTLDVCRQLQALAGETVELPPARRVFLRTGLPPAFWQRLTPRAASGFVLEIWPLIAGAVADLHAARGPRRPRQGRVTAATEPRLDWVEAAAIAAGLPSVELYVAGAGEAGDDAVIPLDGRETALLLGRGVLAGNAAARFRVGRALGLLRHRASVLEHVSAAELGLAFDAAAVVAGGVPQVAPAALANVEQRARALGKAMSRRERKALALEASRFGFERIDAAAFREALLCAADRLGLIMAGDVGIAAGLVTSGEAVPSSSPPGAVIASSERALSLVRFAITEECLELMQMAAVGEIRP